MKLSDLDLNNIDLILFQKEKLDLFFSVKSEIERHSLSGENKNWLKSCMNSQNFLISLEDVKAKYHICYDLDIIPISEYEIKALQNDLYSNSNSLLLNVFFFLSELKDKNISYLHPGFRLDHFNIDVDKINKVADKVLINYFEVDISEDSIFDFFVVDSESLHLLPWIGDNKRELKIILRICNI